MHSENINMLRIVAKGLEELVNRLVFVGGAIVELYTPDAFADDVRPTKDIDCVTVLASRIEYDKIQAKIRGKGFTNDTSQDAPMFRWIYKDIKVDIMPPDESIIGFSNKWYSEGIKYKIQKKLPDNLKIYVFRLEYFLSTKFDAHNVRGGTDLRQSKDFEDIVFILDNYPDVYKHILQSQKSVKHYLKKQSALLLKDLNLTEGIESALPSSAGRERTEMILKTLQKITEL